MVGKGGKDGCCSRSGGSECLGGVEASGSAGCVGREV